MATNTEVLANKTPKTAAAKAAKSAAKASAKAEGQQGCQGRYEGFRSCWQGQG